MRAADRRVSTLAGFGARVGPVVCGVLLAAGCAGIAPDATSAGGAVPPSVASSSATTPERSTASSAPTPTSSPAGNTPSAQDATGSVPGDAEMAATVTELERRHGVRLALAWAPTGHPERVRGVGSVPDVQAWSTIKVPIAIAAARADGGTPDDDTARRMRAAITVSDNDAAAALWRSLGSPDDAAAAVDAVLREAGDATTRAARDGSGSRVSFGITRWTVGDAARFASGLPCVADTLTSSLMGRIAEEHRWGLGRVTGARFKGGWGPSPHGYLVRQIGVVTRADGSSVGVAMAATPSDGSHERGTAALDALARAVDTHLQPADLGRCG